MLHLNTSYCLFIFVIVYQFCTWKICKNFLGAYVLPSYWSSLSSYLESSDFTSSFLLLCTCFCISEAEWNSRMLIDSAAYSAMEPRVSDYVAFLWKWGSNLGGLGWAWDSFLTTFLASHCCWSMDHTSERSQTDGTPIFCTLESPGKFLNLLMPGPHPLPEVLIQMVQSKAWVWGFLKDLAHVAVTCWLNLGTLLQAGVECPSTGLKYFIKNYFAEWKTIAFYYLLVLLI